GYQLTFASATVSGHRDCKPSAFRDHLTGICARKEASPFSGRQPGSDQGPLARLALDLDPALVGFHYLPPDGDAEPRPGRAGSFGEAVEDPRQELGVDARPGVPDRELDAFTGGPGGHH